MRRFFLLEDFPIENPIYIKRDRRKSLNKPLNILPI